MTRIEAIARASFVALAVLATPTPGLADCGQPPSGFGADWWKAYKSWCRACGGTVPEYHSSGATCELPPGGAPSPGGMTAAQTAVVDDVGNAIRGAFEEEARRAAIENQQMQRSLNALSQQRTAEAATFAASRREQEARAQEDAKQNLLSNLKGKRDTDALTLKQPQATATTPKLDFGAYREGERARRDGLDRAQTLSKQDESWCKLHIPLQPTASTYDAAGVDDARQEAYRVRKAEWDRRCGGGQASAANAP